MLEQGHQVVDGAVRIVLPSVGDDEGAARTRSTPSRSAPSRPRRSAGAEHLPVTHLPSVTPGGRGRIQHTTPVGTR